MEPIKITAYLASAIAVHDNYTPAMDGLLTYLELERLGKLDPNPTSAQIVYPDIPLAKGMLGNEWYYQVSSPCYFIEKEQTSNYRKRWDSHQYCNFGKRRAKFTTSEGAEKSYDLALQLRTISSITWYAIANLQGVVQSLSPVTHLGKKRSQGFGQISHWDIQPMQEDWHLWGGEEKHLMRPIPMEEYVRLTQKRGDTADFAPLLWGWRPPSWHHENTVMCACPTRNVKSVVV